MATAATMDTNWTDPTTLQPATGLMGVGVTAPTGTAPNATTTGASAAPNVAPLTANGSLATAGTANASTYDPSNVQVTPDMTVAGQVKGLIDANSPLMQTAETKAKQEQNARGTLNSSMAIQSGQQAVINSALPIATQDAQTNTTAALTNAGASNASKQFNAGVTTDVSKTNAGAQTQVSLDNAHTSTQVAETNVANALQAGIVNQQQANAIAEFNATQGNAMAQFNAGSALDMAKTNINALLQAGIINTQQANAMTQFNVTQANNMALSKLDDQFKAELTNATGANQVTLQQMQGDTQKQLASIQADYQSLISMNSTATSTFNNTLSEIGKIVSDPNMDAPSKATAINGYLGFMKTQMNLIGSVDGVDVGNLLNFGAVTA